jgi:acyl dehydratase
MPTQIASIEDLQKYLGQPLGTSDWKTLPHSQIVAFADATGDHQWIHVDAARCATESPYGAPIAHGYLTLSLVAGQFFEVLELSNFKMIINYGCNKVRFPNPLRAERRYRLSLSLQQLNPIGDWWEAVMMATIEVEGEKKPSCVAEVVYRFLPASN